MLSELSGSALLRTFKFIQDQVQHIRLNAASEVEDLMLHLIPCSFKDKEK